MLTWSPSICGRFRGHALGHGSEDSCSESVIRAICLLVEVYENLAERQVFGFLWILVP